MLPNIDNATFLLAVMAYSQGQIDDIMNEALAEQLQSVWGNTSELASSKDDIYGYGANGGNVVYPAGANGAGASIYWPTFTSFNQQVIPNSSGGWKASPSQPLTTQLSNIYGNIVNAVSAAAQKQMRENQTAINQDILTSWNKNYVPIFGVGTQWYDTTKEQQSAFEPEWISGQVNINTGQPSSSNLSANQIWNIITSSLQYFANYATYYVDTAVQPQYQEMAKTQPSEFLSMVVSGTKQFDQIFTGTLYREQPSASAGGPPGPGMVVMMPWNNQMYTDYVNLKNQIYANVTGAEQANWESGIVASANTTIQNFMQGDLTQDAGVEVYSAGQQLPSGTPTYALNPGVYAVNESSTATSISDGGSGTTTLSTSVSNVTDTSFKYGKSSADEQSYSYSADTGGGWWLWNWSASASGSTSEETKSSFSEFQDTQGATSGENTYANTYYQSWSPSTVTGNAAWLYTDYIQDAYNNSVGSDGATEIGYTSSPSWQGGWGFTTAAAAKQAAKDGFAYIKSIFYSGDPTTTTTIDFGSQSGESSYQSFEKNTEFKTSGSVGFSDWWFGGSASSSYSNSTQQWEASSSSKYDSESNKMTITTKGLGNINGGGNVQEWRGYGALQVGFGAEVIAEPNPAAAGSSSASGKNSEKVKVKSDWYFFEDGVESRNETYVFDKTDNVVLGDTGKQVMKGKKGNDELYGFEGKDDLHGGSHDDFLSGGLGKNTLTGGKGKDYFEMNAMEFTDKKTINKITDFEVNNDVLWFTHGADPAMVSVSGNHVTYGDHKIAKLIGLTSDEMQTAVDTAQYI